MQKYKKAVSKIGNGSILLVIPARIELATYRLGVWRAAWYIVRFIICLVV